jgi:hypothetical protein
MPSFRDISWNRNRSPAELRYQAIELVPGKLPGQFVDLKHKIVCLLPHYKIPKCFGRLIHAGIFYRQKNTVKICCYYLNASVPSIELLNS